MSGVKSAGCTVGTAPVLAPPRHVVPLLAAFASLVVLTTDVYLPVLPTVSTDLHSSAAAASATVSCVLVGIAVGQVVIGPLSDAVGRRVPLLPLERASRPTLPRDSG